MTESTAGDATPDRTGKGPARGYSWAPFQPGHTITTKHGAWSPRRVEPLAADLIAQARRIAPWLVESDVAAVRSWAVAEARAALYGDALVTHAEETDGCALCEVCEPWDAGLAKWSSAAAGHRARLGLDPASRVALGLGVARTELAAAQANAMTGDHLESEIARLTAELGLELGTTPDVVVEFVELLGAVGVDVLDVWPASVLDLDDDVAEVVDDGDG